MLDAITIAVVVAAVVVAAVVITAVTFAIARLRSVLASVAGPAFAERLTTWAYFELAYLAAAWLPVAVEAGLGSPSQLVIMH